MSEARSVAALASGLEGAWRRLPAKERHETAEELAAAVTKETDVVTHSYSMVGLQPGADLLLWSLGPTLESLEQRAAMVLRSGMGTWFSVKESFLGVNQGSQYVKKPTPQEQSLFSGERSRYLTVYPFTQSTVWYLIATQR